MNAKEGNIVSNRFLATQEEMRILLADDRAENLLTLESIIAAPGRKIFKAESGNEALKIAFRENISLLLLDIQMPGMDGVETATILRSNSKTKHIPVIFVSAINQNERIAADKFEPGTVDFLFKPLNLEDTKNKIAFFEKLFRAGNEIQKMKIKSERAAREMERFSYIVSHDLKAPVRAINNLATWIEEDIGSNVNPNTVENLRLLKSRVSRMQTLIDGVLEYSRAGRIQEPKETLAMKPFLEAVIETLVPPRGFSFEVKEPMPTITTEKTKMVKIFSHLIRNTYMHHDKTEGQITIECKQKSDHFLFTVCDDGPGINPDYHKNIFEIFQTLQPKDHNEMVGAGLAIVKKIVEDQGCKVWVESQAGSRGSKFCFTWK